MLCSCRFPPGSPQISLHLTKHAGSWIIYIVVSNVFLYVNVCVVPDNGPPQTMGVFPPHTQRFCNRTRILFHPDQDKEKKEKRKEGKEGRKEKKEGRIEKKVGRTEKKEGKKERKE